MSNINVSVFAAEALVTELSAASATAALRETEVVMDSEELQNRLPIDVSLSLFPYFFFFYIVFVERSHSGDSKRGIYKNQNQPVAKR
jgi:hypothetical protein